MDLKERQEIKCLNRHPWELSRCKVVKDILRPVMKKGSCILDIGCGDLFLEEYLLGFYPDSHCFCVDIAYTNEEVEELNRKFKHVRVYNTMDAFASEVVEIDVILLLDVVEHIEKDREFMQTLLANNFVRNDAQILITVPAFQCLYTSHDHFLGHYRRYNLKRLKQLMQESGLEKRQCGYFYSILLFPRFMQWLKEKCVGVNKETTGLVEWKGGKAVTRTICWILTSDYKIGKFLSRIGIQLPGLSNYALCRRKPVL